MPSGRHAEGRRECLQSRSNEVQVSNLFGSEVPYYSAAPLAEIHEAESIQAEKRFPYWGATRAKEFGELSFGQFLPGLQDASEDGLLDPVVQAASDGEV